MNIIKKYFNNCKVALSFLKLKHWKSVFKEFSDYKKIPITDGQDLPHLILSPILSLLVIITMPFLFWVWAILGTINGKN